MNLHEWPRPWGNGFSYPEDNAELASKYNTASTTVYEALRMTSKSVEQYIIKQFFDKFCPAAEAWYFLCKEYASKENMGQNKLIH